MESTPQNEEVCDRPIFDIDVVVFDDECRAALSTIPDKRS
jgi:hypothetical protein